MLFSLPLRTTLSQVSTLFSVAASRVERINGIPAAARQWRQRWQQAPELFVAMANKPMLPWPTMSPLPGPGLGGTPHLKPKPSLLDLALAQGIPVWAAHRALADCIDPAQVLLRCMDLEGLLLEARQPRQLYKAKLSDQLGAPGQDRGVSLEQPGARSLGATPLRCPTGAPALPR